MHHVKLSKIKIASEKIGDLVRTVWEIVAYVQYQHSFCESVLFVCKACQYVGYHHSSNVAAAKRSNKVFGNDHLLENEKNPLGQIICIGWAAIKTLKYWQA